MAVPRALARALVLQGWVSPVLFPVLFRWRVLLVPYLEANMFYERYDFDEPWDGPSNRPLHRELFDDRNGVRTDITLVRELYPLAAGEKKPRPYSTNYVMLVDPGQPLVPFTAGTSLQKEWQCRRNFGGDAAIIAVGESKIHWMEPRDVSAEELGSDRPDDPRSQRILGAMVVKKDGAFEILNAAAAKSLLRAFGKD